MLPRRVGAVSMVGVLLLSTFLVLAPPVGFRAFAAGETVEVWVTTGDKTKLLAKQANVQFGSDGSDNPLTVDVNEMTVYQSMDGYGAALTDSSAWLIYNKLSATQRDTLLRQLFSPTEGIGLSYVRLPMGASDFALSDYTYDDMPPGETDPTLANFSIDYDRAYIIPVLKEILAINPDVKVMGSPWSPPAWMKTNDSLFGGSLKPEYYDVYADYFVKFVQAYATEGISIHAVTVQNEPHHTSSSYPTARWEPEEEASVAKSMGAKFASNNISTKTIVWDHNWDQSLYPERIYDYSADAKPYIAGSAWHCYGGNPPDVSNVRAKHPVKGIYFTECSSGLWSTDWGNNFKWDMEKLIIGASRNWAKTVVKWNLALDENNGPQNGGCTNCTGVVTINSTDGAVTYNHDYYALGQASKFVKPGAVRIASPTWSYFESIAFKNPDGSKVVILLNKDPRDHTAKVRWGGQAFTYKVPKGSAATFVWSGTQAEPSAPAAPASLSASAGDTQVRLSWAYSPLAASYNVKRATTSGGPYTTIATGVTADEFYDSGLTNGTTYYYVVTAVNSKGESAASPQASATPQAPPTTKDAKSNIQAELYDWRYGTSFETCSEGGWDLSHTHNNDYAGYKSVDFGTGLKKAYFRVATATEGGSIEIRLGSPTGTLIGTATVANTGGWQTWKTISTSISGVTGVHDVYLVFKGAEGLEGITNLNYFYFATR